MLHCTYTTHADESMTLKSPSLHLQEAIKNLEKPIIGLAIGGHYSHEDWDSGSFIENTLNIPKLLWNIQSIHGTTATRSRMLWITIHSQQCRTGNQGCKIYERSSCSVQADWREGEGSKQAVEDSSLEVKQTCRLKCEVGEDGGTSNILPVSRADRDPEPVGPTDWCGQDELHVCELRPLQRTSPRRFSPAFR